MPAYLIHDTGEVESLTLGNGEFDRNDIDSVIDYVLKVLDAESYEDVPGVTAYQGKPAQMYADEMALDRALRFNEAATAIRDANYEANQIPIPADSGLHGKVLILTESDRLE